MTHLRINLKTVSVIEFGPRTTRCGQTSFAVSVPTLWNTLTPTVRDPSLSLTQVCAPLKAVLFYTAYETLS